MWLRWLSRFAWIECQVIHASPQHGAPHPGTTEAKRSRLKGLLLPPRLLHTLLRVCGVVLGLHPLVLFAIGVHRKVIDTARVSLLERVSRPMRTTTVPLDTTRAHSLDETPRSGTRHSPFHVDIIFSPAAAATAPFLHPLTRAHVTPLAQKFSHIFKNPMSHFQSLAVGIQKKQNGTAVWPKPWNHRGKEKLNA